MGENFSKKIRNFRKKILGEKLKKFRKKFLKKNSGKLGEKKTGGFIFFREKIKLPGRGSRERPRNLGSPKSVEANAQGAGVHRKKVWVLSGKSN